MLHQTSLSEVSQIYEFNDGRDEIIKRIERCFSKPVIIAVFGIPDSGKTHLIDFIGEYFERLDFKTRKRDNKEKINLYESWTEFDNLPSLRRIADELSLYDINMYHCSWDDLTKPWDHKVDPEESVREAMDRGLDLSIGIFNPKRSSPPKGNFNLIISNRSSWEKPWYPDD